MAGLKYSRQREVILAFLHSTKAHPTAEMIYMELRKTNPKLSLGTVYRNLNLLVECGELQRLSCGDGMDHYDATVTPHYHFVCEKCGAVRDLDMPQVLTEDAAAGDEFVGEVHRHQIYFYGICKQCM